MRRTALALLVSVWSAAGGVAVADPPAAPSPADELYRAGKEAYARKDYRRAAELFEQAHETSQDPVLLFNIAQAYRLDGQCAEAARRYRTFLDAAPDAPNRRDAEDKLAAMEACARAEAEPAEAQEVVTVHQGAPPPAARRDDAPRGSAAGLWVAGGGAVLLGVSTYFWWSARDADRELDDLFGEGGTFDGHHQDLQDRVQRHQTIALVTTGVGVAAIAGGLLYHLVLRPRGESPAPASVGLVRGGAVLVLGCAL